MKIYPMLAMRNWIIFFSLSAILGGCKTLTISSIKKGKLEGRVLLQQFNQQGVTSKTKSQAVSRWVYLLEPSSLQDLVNAKDNTCEDILSKKVDSVLSTKNGNYSFNAVAGKYSIVIKLDKGYFIPYFSGSTGVAHVIIDAQQPLSLDLIIRNEATY
jgi:hypothetical protein